MVKRILVLSLLVFFGASLNGCAMFRKEKKSEIQELKNQVTLLESQIQSKDGEINSLKDALARAEQEKQEQVAKMPKKKIIIEVKSRPNVKQIQAALINAGYDVGRIDGKMGRKTREAIKAFQKANNLSADGRVGKDTWNLLRGYLAKKVK